MAYLEEHLLPRVWRALMHHGADPALIDEVRAAMPQGMALSDPPADSPAAVSGESAARTPAQHIGTDAASGAEMAEQANVQSAQAGAVAAMQDSPVQVMEASPSSVQFAEPVPVEDAKAVVEATEAKGNA